MQTVSTAWKNAQNQNLVPESFVEVLLNVGDPDAQGDASATDNGSIYFANTPTIVTPVETNPVQYATLEQNQWILNGTATILPNAAPYGENGFISSALSGSDGTFGSNPTITISFSQVWTNVIPGITVKWSEDYNEWAEEFNVTVYNSGTVVGSRSVTGNTSVASVVEFDIQNYDEITIEIVKWSLPFHRARVSQLIVGVERTYSKTDLMSFSHTMLVDPLSATLPKAEITMELNNIDGRFNPDNPQGVEQYLLERQLITARYGYKLNGSVEWIKAGTFYMSEWQSPQNGITATFQARDALEFMTDLYTGTSSGTLYDIALAAFNQSGLPLQADGTVRWIIDASLSSVAVPSGVDLSKNSIREVLQYCANAACCVFYQDRDGVVHIEPLASGTTDYAINQFNSFQNSEISLTKQLKAVEINNKDYVLNVSDTGDTQVVTNPLISTARAPVVAQWIADYLANRRELNGEFRIDPRLDALDRITNTNRFSTSTVLVTEVVIDYNGAFKGQYSGRNGA